MATESKHPIFTTKGRLGPVIQPRPGSSMDEPPRRVLRVDVRSGSEAPTTSSVEVGSPQRGQSRLIYGVGKSALYSVLFLAILLLVSPGLVLGVTIENPIAAKSFPELIQQIAKAVRLIAFPLAVVAIIFVGFKFVISSARGDEKGLGEAKKMFFWVVIGTAIIVGASVLAEAIVNFAKTL